MYNCKQLRVDETKLFNKYSSGYCARGSKFYDTDNWTISNPTLSAWNPFCQGMFKPIQGTDVNQRIGRQAIIKRIWLKVYIRCNNQFANIDTYPQICRVILAYDNEQTQIIGIPQPTDYLVPSSGPSYIAINSLCNYDWSKMQHSFSLLYDKTFNMGGFANEQTPTPTTTFSAYTQGAAIKNIDVVLDVELPVLWAVGGSGASPITGGLTLILLGSLTDTVVNGHVFKYSVRTEYDDG